MARKHNVDKVYNYIMTETDLSKDQCHELLDVVEKQFSQNIQQQRKDELTQQSQRDRSLMKMFEENRIVK
ncbi:hypothetical protein DT246_11615 [Staphylococcus haemolyticus]|uniref:hypothetical protein n=1 Tax=Staphylococcus TaxID=1279 RepID=UPI00069F1F26|nr:MULTISPECIES: hypothetical protein [Staphylococcus]RFU02481.1 hypothetical protein DT246_11615 [Staphylococcus haemolyticus]RFU04441.1 hypothetical protein DT247_08205 [Staphylococcus haemolyticus]